MTAAVRVLHVYEPATAGVPTFVAALRAIELDGVEQAAAGPVGPDYVCGTGSRRPAALATYVEQALAAVRAFDPDVIHLHSTLAGLLTPLLGRRRRRIIYSPHAWDTWARSGAPRWASSVVHRALRTGHDRLAYLSDDEHDEGRRLGYGERCRPLGSLLPGDPADVAAADAPPPIVLFVGRAGHQKGDDHLPAIAAALGSRARVVAVGPGLTDLGPGVEVTGPLADVRPWYQRAAVLVQPSRYEGLSLVSIEAASHGLPIVGFDVVGMRWLAATGLGTLVPLDDVAALVAAVTARLDEPLDGRRRRAEVTRSMFGRQHLAANARRLYLEQGGS
jgi:glycosyltransferase involved in cell wall biosynthesis